MDQATKALFDYGAVGVLAFFCIVAIIALFKQFVIQRNAAESLKEVVQSNTQAMKDGTKAVSDMASSVQSLSEGHTDIVNKLLDKLQ